MRIGIITGEYPPMEGGVGAYTHILAQNFIDLGHDVFILSNNKAIETNAKINLNNTIRRWGPISLLKIRKWVRENVLDIVNIQFETAAYQMSGFVHFIPNVLNVPVVTTFHDLYVPYLFPKAGKLRNQIMIHLARKSAGVIGTNSEDMQQLNRLPPAKLIPIGSNILSELSEDFEAEKLRHALNIQNEDFLVGHFGFINHSKGVDTLLEDIASIRNYYDYPIKVLMIGGRVGASDPTNAKYVQTIDRKINELDLVDHVIWTGFVSDEDVSNYLEICDILALPYRDGASYRRGSLMAAIHHGCAIVTTEPRVDIPLFNDGENMLLCQSHVINEKAPAFTHITPQILKLYRDPDLRMKLCDGAKKLSAHFDWSKISQDYIVFFEKFVGE